jgi:hypothetical protein
MSRRSRDARGPRAGRRLARATDAFASEGAGRPPGRDQTRVSDAKPEAPVTTSRGCAPVETQGEV